MAKVENLFKGIVIEENINGINYFPSYEFLIDIYLNNNDYLSLIKVLNRAIKYSNKKDCYRKLRKTIIFNKIIQDINTYNPY